MCMDAQTFMTVSLVLFLLQIGIVDPDCRLIGLHLYDGLFKVSLLSQASAVQGVLRALTFKHKYCFLFYTIWFFLFS